MSQAFWQAFFTLHQDLPREGPGSDAGTRRALGLLPALPAEPRVADLGCGPGKQTLVLAGELKALVLAVDFHQPYLDQLKRSAAGAGLSHLIQTRCADMGSLSDPPDSFDLIWSEGAIYILGFARGLELWRPLLASGGCLVASELTWLESDPPAEVRDYFTVEYPAMTDVGGNLALAEEAGYEVLAHFPLENQAWWDNYYQPLARRAEALAEQAKDDPDLAAVLAENQTETDIWRRFGGSFGYVFYLLRKSA